MFVILLKLLFFFFVTRLLLQGFVRILKQFFKLFFYSISSFSFFSGQDVAWLASKLGNLKSSTRIEDSEWNHVNFLFSTDAKRLVYDKFIPLLPKAS